MSVQNGERLATKQDLADMYQEILPYLGGSADAGFTPVGSVIAIMGVTAPANYLACDGTVYNISDYPELANYFYQQFGSKNKFGGNGTTTFAVPDLRGEFLRGTGTNSHSGCGNGDNVGTHQAPTYHKNFLLDGSGRMATYAKDTGTRFNADTEVSNVTDGWRVQLTNYTAASSPTYVTSRPTNTSILWCIATKNIYMNPSLDYSTVEKVVGTWIDGKTLYQRTFTAKFGTITDETQSRIEIDISSLNIDVAFIINAFLMASGSAIASLNDTYNENGKYQLRTSLSKSTNLLYIFCNRDIYSNADAYVTIQYTKAT